MRGVTSAKELVDYINSQKMFRGISQQKYARATVTRRTYSHLTKLEVDRLTPKELISAKSVKTLHGKFTLRKFIETSQEKKFATVSTDSYLRS